MSDLTLVGRAREHHYGWVFLFVKAFEKLQEGE